MHTDKKGARQPEARGPNRKGTGSRGVLGWVARPKFNSKLDIMLIVAQWTKRTTVGGYGYPDYFGLTGWSSETPERGVKQTGELLGPLITQFSGLKDSD